ncbi:hypothetical protein BpHYR1_050162, partial [Brachionus plicatilis]
SKLTHIKKLKKTFISFCDSLLLALEQLLESSILSLKTFIKFNFEIKKNWHGIFINIINFEDELESYLRTDEKR